MKRVLLALLLCVNSITALAVDKASPTRAKVASPAPKEYFGFTIGQTLDQVIAVLKSGGAEHQVSRGEEYRHHNAAVVAFSNYDRLAKYNKQQEPQRQAPRPGPQGLLDQVMMDARAAAQLDPPSALLFTPQDKLYGVVLRWTEHGTSYSQDGLFIKLRDVLEAKYGAPTRKQRDNAMMGAGIGFSDGKDVSIYLALNEDINNPGVLELRYTHQPGYAVMEKIEKDWELKKKQQERTTAKGDI